MKLFRNISYFLKVISRAKISIIIYEILYRLIMNVKHYIYYILLFGQIFSLLQRNADIKEIIMWLSLATIFTIFNQIYSDWYINVFRPKAILELNYILNRKLYEKAAYVDINCYESKNFYDRFTASINEAHHRIEQLITVISNIISGLIMVVIYSYTIISKDIWALSLAIIPIVSVFVFGKLNNKLNYDLYETNISQVRIKDYIKRTIYLKEYTKEYRVSNVFNVLFNYFNDSIVSIIKNIKKFGVKIALLQIFNNFFSNTFMLLSAILYGTYLMMVPQTLQIGDYYILVSAIFNLMRTLLNFSHNIVSLSGMSPFMDNLIVFLEYKNSVYNELCAKRNVESIKNISLKNVFFKYPNTDKYVLEDISMEIGADQKIAVVGYNGSGKTTLIKLLLRLYDTSIGSIEYNDDNIKSLDIDEYRKQFGVCFQDSKLFALNVYENIVLDNDMSKEVLVEKAMSDSGIYEKVISCGGIKQQMTKEFDREGLALSGGERQKLALARVFAKESSVIILDEPTSALDPISEEELFKNILNVCDGKTVIYISHRLSSAKLADKIFFLKDGKIVEEGTHFELIKKNGYYAEMFYSQAKGYWEGKCV